MDERKHAFGTRGLAENAIMSRRAMQEATFLILTALASDSKHGHAIVRDVLEISGGRVRLDAGTLYPALERLRANGLIALDREEVVQSRFRRYYRLTAAGRERLATESTRLRVNSIAAMSRLNLATKASVLVADVSKP